MSGLWLNAKDAMGVACTSPGTAVRLGEMSENLARRIEGAKRGDEASIRALLDAHLPSLHAYLRLHAGRLVRAKESSMDLVQSVCREALEAMEDFEYRGDAAFRHWLFTAARRKVIDKARFYQRECRDAAREVSPEALAFEYRSICTPSQDAAAREQLELVERAFDELPADYREVITLARIVRLKHPEIAERMGRTPVATRRLLNRALARLSSALVRDEKGS